MLKLSGERFIALYHLRGSRHAAEAMDRDICLEQTVGVIFPNYGGRFTFTPEACRDLVDGATREMGPLEPIFPVPAGGMNLGRVPEIVHFYGSNVILLIGGDLHRHGDDLSASCRRFVRLIQ